MAAPGQSLGGFSGSAVGEAPGGPGEGQQGYGRPSTGVLHSSRGGTRDQASTTTGMTMGLRR
jgi:hypothetical protein